MADQKGDSGSGSCLRVAALIAAACPLAAPAAAQTAAWSSMAEQDLDAAYRLLAETHPGALPATGDAQFLAALRTGREAAQRIAAEARTYGAYRAALERFAAEFRDAHISSAPLFPTRQSWPGFIVFSRGGRWTVVAAADDAAPPVGSELLACDGRSPDRLAEERLAPTVADWSVPAQRIRASRNLLLDSGSPLHPQLTACTFRPPAGGQYEQRLSWRPLSQPQLAAQLNAAIPVASEEVALRPFETGFWVRLGTLSGAAHAVVTQAEEQRLELRRAPFVVVDLRGNGGGASAFSDRLARAIYGARRVAEVQRRTAAGPATMVWRASPGALAYLENVRVRAAGLGPPTDSFRRGLEAQHAALAAALARGMERAEAPEEVRSPAEDRADRVARPPRVILVTDRFCFSSCLLAARLFRNLGALHVGEATSANTHYSNARSVELPSGLSTFTTLQAYMPSLPRIVGPFEPAVTFEGNLADDSAVQARIRTLLALPPR